MMVDEESLAFELIVGQKKEFEDPNISDIVMSSCPNFWPFID